MEISKELHAEIADRFATEQERIESEWDRFRRAGLDVRRAAQEFLGNHFKDYVGEGVTISQRVTARIDPESNTPADEFVVQVSERTGFPWEKEEVSSEDTISVARFRYEQSLMHQAGTDLAIDRCPRYRIEIYLAGSRNDRTILFVATEGNHWFAAKGDGTTIFQHGDEIERMQMVTALLESAVTAQRGQN